MRSRLFAAADQAPECAATDFLSNFLGPPPFAGQIAPADEQYLRHVCTAINTFDLGLIEWLAGYAEVEDIDGLVELLAVNRDLVAELSYALNWALPPADLSAFHEDFLALLTEAVDALGTQLDLVEEEGDEADVGELEARLGVLDRIYGEPGEPVAPSPARERLLVAAAALPECGAVVLEDFLGVEE